MPSKCRLRKKFEGGGNGGAIMSIIIRKLEVGKMPIFPMLHPKFLRVPCQAVGITIVILY